MNDIKTNVELDNQLPIKVICPICSKKSTLLVLKEEVVNKRSGIASVFIPSFTICEHSFYIYVDQQGNARDYLVADISITDQLDAFKLDKEKILAEVQPKDLTGLNLFRFISEKDFQSLLYACFINIEILFIESNLFRDEFSSDQFKFVFAYMIKLFPESFNSFKVISNLKFKDYQDLKSRKTDSYFYIFNGKVFANDVIYERLFKKITETLKHGDFETQQQNSIIMINQLRAYSEYLKPKINILPENKLLKKLQKKFKDKTLTLDTIRIIKKKYEILEDCEPLSNIKSNTVVYIRKVFDRKLLSLGFIRGAKIEVVKNLSGSVVVMILNSKVGLGKQAADQIFVKQYKKEENY
jgi:Fe2+ transport system protein FeoA